MLWQSQPSAPIPVPVGCPWEWGGRAYCHSAASQRVGLTAGCYLTMRELASGKVSNFILVWKREIWVLFCWFLLGNKCYYFYTIDDRVIAPDSSIAYRALEFEFRTSQSLISSGHIKASCQLDLWSLSFISFFHIQFLFVTLPTWWLLYEFPLTYLKYGPGHATLFLGLIYRQWGKGWTRSLLSYLQAPQPSKGLPSTFYPFFCLSCHLLERVGRLLLNGPWAPKPEASSIIFIVEGRINQLKEGSSAEQGSLRANDDSVRYAGA